MKVLVLLEFGIPPYRDFLFRHLSSMKEVTDFLVVHTGQKFQDFNHPYNSQEVRTNDFHHLSLHRDVLPLIDRFDLVISSFNIYRPMCWLPMIWKRKKWILWGPGLGRNRLNWMNKLIRMPFIQRCCKFIVYTSSAKNELVERWAIDGSKILVANNTLFIPNAEYNSHTKRDYLLYVGRIQERKGLVKVLQALRILKQQRGIHIPFVIVGDGPYKKVLQEYVHKHGQEDQVHFYKETFDENTLRKYLSKALCYVSPDHVGLGVVHAFSYGVPVLTSTIKEHAREYQYCNKENSILYSADSELPNEIANLHENPSLSYQRGKSGYEFYKDHLSHHHMNEIFSDAVKDCIKDT